MAQAPHPSNPNEPSRNDRLKDLVSRAIALPASDRAGFIASQCADDVALALEVRELVAAHEAASNFLANPTNSETNAPTALGPITEKPGSRIGPYKLLELIGEGGFGSVFMADQDSPVRRRVALKIIKLGMDTKQVVARFEQERQALALMDHPNIAKVLDAGTTPLTSEGGGRPFFVMEYVKGDPINAFADAHKLSIADRLDLFVQVCLAVQHAHQKGVIHRDLKPSNVLASMSDGKPFARVIDFGIAKATGALGGRLTDKTLFTEHRQLIGTPEYMSPEQADGSPDLDTRTDVYALGVLLYELLTGATPFDAKRLRSAAFGEMQRIIKEEEPPMPSVRLERSLKLVAQIHAKLNEPIDEPDARARDIHTPTNRHTPRDLAGELDWIVMKALDKDRARRYETPSALAQDVRRHLAGEAVLAAPPTMGYRVRKFVRKNKGAVLASCAVTTTLLAGIAGTTWGLLKEQQQKQIVIDAAAQANAAVGETMNWLQNVDLLEGNADRIRVDADGTKRTAKGNVESIVTARGSRWTQQPVIGGYFAGGSDPGDNLRAGIELIRKTAIDQVRDARSYERQYRQQAEEAEWSAYTANLALAQTALVADDYPEARRIMERVQPTRAGWEATFLKLRANRAICVLKELNNSINSAVFSLDGTRILTAPHDNTSRVWNAASGETIAVLKGHTDRVNSAVFSPDGTRILTSSDDKTARVWNAVTSTPLAILEGHTRPVDHAVFSPDSTRIFTHSYDKTGRIWDAATGATIAVLGGATDSVRSAVFSPDGRLILTASSDRTARLWDATSGVSVGVLDGHTDSVVSAVFSPDGTRILTASSDRTARLWDAATRTTIAKLGEPTHSVRSAVFSPDGRHVLTSSFERTARLWDATSGASVGVLEGHSDSVLSAVFSPDGTRILTASFDYTSRVWNAAAAMPIATLELDGKWLESPVFSPDGTRFVAEIEPGDDGIIICKIDTLETETSSLGGIQDFGIHSETDPNFDLRLAFIRDGRPETRALTITIPDNSRLLRGSSDGTIRFYDASAAPSASTTAPIESPQRIEGLREVAVFRMPNGVINLEMTPDGTRLIIALADGSYRVWDIRDPEERRKDLQAEWAERVPAGHYLDMLLAGPTPTEKLEEAVRTDPSLTPLRRLVACEMLEGRTFDIDRQADEAFKEFKKPFEDPAWRSNPQSPASEKPDSGVTVIEAARQAALRAAVASADLPPRVKEAVLAKAAAWKYVPAQASDAKKLAEETAKRQAAESDAAKQREFAVDALAFSECATYDSTDGYVTIFFPLTHAAARHISRLPGLVGVNFAEYYKEFDIAVGLLADPSTGRKPMTEFDLGYTNKVTDETLNSIARPNTALSELTYLGVSDTSVTDAGLTVLAGPTTGLKNLTVLSLRNTNVTDVGLTDLARADSGLKNLASLDLTGTKVTDEGIAAIKARFPGVKINH